MAHHKGGSGMPNASNGSDREYFVSEFLSKILPSDLKFASGAIIDSFSVERSGQIDLAVLMPTTPSLPMPGGEERLMLAEGVAAAIEIKSNLSTDWSGVKNTTKEIKKLIQRKVHGEELHRIPVYAIGYKGWAGIEGMKKVWEATSQEERPDAVLMLENPVFISRESWGDKEQALYAFTKHLSNTILYQRQFPSGLESYIHLGFPRIAE